MFFQNFKFKNRFFSLLILLLFSYSCTKKDTNKIIYELNENIQDTIYKTMLHKKNNLINSSEEPIFYITYGTHYGEHYFSLDYYKDNYNLDYIEICEKSNRTIKIKDEYLCLVFGGDILFSNIKEKHILPSKMGGATLFIISEETKELIDIGITM